jgi:YD repeat-containing protein
MRHSPSTAAVRWRAIVLATAAFVFAIPAALFAHAVVFPKASNTGAYERYVLRVPNEKNVATTKVELHFPSDVRVTSFSDVPGWQLEITRDSAQRIVGATWTGTLQPERFVEFPFVAVNPKTATQVNWPAYQTYADGQRVEWTGAEGSKTPASVTAVSVATTSAGGGGSQSTFVLAVVALALAVVSLGLAMRKRE